MRSIIQFFCRSFLLLACFSNQASADPRIGEIYTLRVTRDTPYYEYPGRQVKNGFPESREYTVVVADKQQGIFYVVDWRGTRFWVEGGDLFDDVDFSGFRFNEDVRNSSVLEIFLDKSHIDRGLSRSQLKEVNRLYSISAQRLLDNPYWKRTPQMCANAPKYPKIPPASQGSCEDASIAKAEAECVIGGLSEFACGEILEGLDVRALTGAKNGAACNVLISGAMSGQVSLMSVLESSAYGYLDNVGEEIGGVSGGIIRGVSGLGKYSSVLRCQEKVRLSCDPSPLLRKYHKSMEQYVQCISDSKVLSRALMLNEWN